MVKNKIKERAFFLLVGIAFEEVVANFFDYALYPFVIWKCGLLKGGAIMALLSLAVCYVMLVLYNFIKKDWFGIELAKELREYQGQSRVFKVMSWALRRGQLVAFLFLSLKFDPFTTTAYLRPGANKFLEMDRKSWQIFFASWLVANLSWIIVVFTGVSIAEYTWKILK